MLIAIMLIAIMLIAATPPAAASSAAAPPPVAPASLPASAKSNFERDGFAVVRGFLQEETAEKLPGWIDEVAATPACLHHSERCTDGASALARTEVGLRSSRRHGVEKEDLPPPPNLSLSPPRRDTRFHPVAPHVAQRRDLPSTPPKSKT